MGNNTWFGTPRLETQNVKICYKFWEVWRLCPLWSGLCFTGSWTSYLTWPRVI